MKNKCLIVQNYWAAPYKLLLFNCLHKRMVHFTVLYLAETENIREWRINRDDVRFSYDVMFRGSVDNHDPWRVAYKVWIKLNEYNPETVIIGGYKHFAYWSALFWAKMHKRKVVIWMDSTEMDHPRNKIKELVKTFFIRLCDAGNPFGTLSNNYLVKLGMAPERIGLNINCSDNNFYCTETRKLRYRKQSLCQNSGLPPSNFLYIGRFSPEKHIHSLLDAYRRLKQNGVKDWGLILVGNGPQKNEIEHYIKTKSIKEVLLPGFKQKDELPTFLAMSDVFILPSISEPWGLVVNEAMAAGLPVLVSKRCGCYPDLIKEGINGFTFDPLIKDELYAHLTNVVECKYDLEMMGKASLEIIKDFTPEKAAKAVEDTIEFVYRNK